MSDAVTQAGEQPVYHIGGSAYRLEPLSWQQNKWLGEHIFNGIDMHRLDYPTVHDLLREKGALFMAICLIGVGMSRAEHSRLSFAAITQRAGDFAAELTGEEVARFGIHFFRSCLTNLAQMALLTPGKALQQAASEQAAPSPVPGEPGSSAVSSRSPEEISPSSTASSPSGDRLSPIPTSGDASSERQSTEPSLAGAASGSPG